MTHKYDVLGDWMFFFDPIEQRWHAVHKEDIKKAIKSKKMSTNSSISSTSFEEIINYIIESENPNMLN